MTERSRKILDGFQIRKSKKQKEDFRQWLAKELTGMGYSVTVEKSALAKNVVVGDPEKAKVIYTAHYDTCAVLPIPNFITPRNLLWYLLYQSLVLLLLFLLAVAAEIAVLLLWDVAFHTDCPLALAIGVVYAVLLFGFWWILDGPANKHTVNDNTSGVLTLLEIAEALPETLRDKVALVFFDNEEKGLLGSSAFVKRHKALRKSGLVMNFDCVSDGDFIQFFPTRALKKQEKTLAAMERAFLSAEEKSTEVVRDFGFYPSDQKKFQKGVGICALKKSSVFGYYMDRIHTKKDTVLMEENIHLLRDGAVRFAESLSEQTKTKS